MVLPWKGIVLNREATLVAEGYRIRLDYLSFRPNCDGVYNISNSVPDGRLDEGMILGWLRRDG